jgi:deoxyribodipyrimidine photo-lyase
MEIVWFKRDLRITDHAALAEAAVQGQVCPLYIIEPDMWAEADASRRHYDFLTDALLELDAALTALGQGLIIRVGNAVEVLAALQAETGFTRLWSHQETGNGWSYARDRAVKKWARAHNIEWREYKQHGVMRGGHSRDKWAANWHKEIYKAQVPPPEKLRPIDLRSEALPTAADLGLGADDCPGRQKGGRREALSLLGGFLSARGRTYRRDMSSPLTGEWACSRLSPHFSFGTLSIREALHASEARRRAPMEKGWAGSLKAFESRLRWHCHFIQKLEDEPAIEFRNMHPAYDGLREDDFDQARFEAWAEGRTGYPFIDACMRSLAATGWLNFRMRAMLMSFASYHLWLHWRETSLHLARLFTDYEPGIHYAQAQMQSGTTGINTMRIYNPVKQSQDQDPDGVFLRKWVPEIAHLPTHLIHTPWAAPDKGAYPEPIIDERRARKVAADRLYSLRQTGAHRRIAGRVVEKHASRAAPPRRHKAGPRGGDTRQIELDI